MIPHLTMCYTAILNFNLCCVFLFSCLSTHQHLRLQDVPLDFMRFQYKTLASKRGNVATAVLRSAGPLRAGIQEHIGLSCIHMHYMEYPPISMHSIDFLPRICHVSTYFPFKCKICRSAYFKPDLTVTVKVGLKYAL